MVGSDQRDHGRSSRLQQHHSFDVAESWVGTRGGRSAGGQLLDARQRPADRQVTSTREVTDGNGLPYRSVNLSGNSQVKEVWTTTLPSASQGDIAYTNTLSVVSLLGEVHHRRHFVFLKYVCKLNVFDPRSSSSRLHIQRVQLFTCIDHRLIWFNVTGSASSDQIFGYSLSSLV